MAEDRMIVQLHKKDDTNEKWIPLTTGKCVQLTDYENNNETGEIVQTDNLNNALSKLENRKADKGASLADYEIADAYTKDEVNALLSGIYHVRGSLASANIHSTLLNENTKEGDVYDLSDDTVMTSDFIEYEGSATPIAAGTNIVVVNTGTDENPLYKFDVLALTIAQAISVATSLALGGIKIGYTTDATNRNYAVELDGNDKAYVNVPWVALPDMTGKTGKFLKVVENNGTLVASWENDNDTQYESKTEAQYGTDVSLVTTGDKYKWNRKQDALPDMTGKAGKCLKVKDNDGTLELSWETDNNTGVTSVSAGTGLNTVSNNETADGGTITGSGTLYLTKSGASAGSYGDTSAQTPSFGDTFKVPYITVDVYGRVTAISEHTVALPSTPSYTLSAATSSALGGIKIGYTDATEGTRNYAVVLDSNNRAYVNVPWSDNNKYVNSAAFVDDTTNHSDSPVKMTLTMTDSNTVVTNIPKVSSASAGVVPKGAAVSSQSQSTKFLREDGTWAVPSYTATYSLSTATSNSLGGIKIGYSQNEKNYPVQLNQDKAYVNVPWENTDTHYTAVPILGAAYTSKANATTATGNTSTYLNIIEDNNVSGYLKITGSGLVSVSALNGELTITGSNPLPSQSGNNNKFLMTNGAALSWATPSDLNTFRVIQVNNTQLLANDDNKAFDIIGGRNVTLTTGGGGSNDSYASVTIDVPITDNKPSVSSGASSIAFKYGNNYFVGASAETAQSVAAGTAVTTLTVTNGNGVNDSTDFEANIFFKAGASGSSMTVTLPSGFLVIGEQPEYVSGNVYLLSLYKGTAIFGEMTVSQ